MRRSGMVWLLVLVLVALPSSLWAQDIEAGADDYPTELEGSAGGAVSFGQLGEDFFTTVYLQAQFAITKLSVGLQLPLRLRVIDEDPQDDGVIRAEDWDEVSDYLRLIRFVQWAQPGETFYIRAGEFSGATLGHGTVMSNYLNVVDFDHFQLGVDTELNLAFGGGELVLDNLAGPEVFGARAYVRPWSFVDPDSYFTNWSVGSSLLFDIGAPMDPKTDASNDPIIDDANNLEYNEEAIVAWGLDTDFIVFENDWVQVVPYMDHNLLFAQEVGYGFHLGVLNHFTLPAQSGIDLRLEYQFLAAHYAPQYFDSTYEIQRKAYPYPSAYPADTRPLTKQEVVGALDESAHGYLSELMVNILGMVRVSGRLRGSSRDGDNDLLLQLLLPKVSRVTLGAFYAKSGFDDAAEAFDLDGGLLQAYARVNVWSFVDLIASYNRSWRLNNDEDSQDYGRYESVDEWNFGVGASFSF